MRLQLWRENEARTALKSRESGKWQVRITYTDSGGKRRVYKRLAEKKTAAKELLAPQVRLELTTLRLTAE